MLLGFTILYFIKIESREYAVSFQHYKVKEEVEAVDNLISETLDDLKTFYVLKDDVSKNDFSLTVTHIYQLFLVNKSVENIKIISPGGQEILGVSRVGLASEEELKNVKEEEYFKAVISGNIYISDLVLDGQDTYIDIIVPYLDNFRLKAVVSAKINLKYFFYDIVSENVPGEGHMHILSNDGIILAAPEESYVGKDISDGELFKKIKESDESIGYVECNPCVEKHEFDTIASSHKMKSEPYFIIISENSEANIFELYYNIRNIFGIFSGLLAIISVSLFLIFNFKIKKTVKVLTDGIFRFHEGKYDEKIILKTGDELEYIAWHINHLVSKVERSIDEKNQSIEKLKEVDILKYNFIKTISHQLRTPVNSILWLTENLISQISGQLSFEQKSIFQDINKSVGNINKIIDDMILMAEIDDRKVLLTKSSANCDDIIDSAIMEVQNKAREKNIILEYQKPQISLPQCEGDVKKIKFIFTRILDNAIKYSEKEKKVIITAKAANKEIIFGVQDQGMGIPAAEQQKIFTKFYRASNSYKLVQDASGLSLYICKYFIELHGGRIWFDSKEGDGSVFYFSLPVK